MKILWNKRLKKIEQLNETLVGIGFEKKSIKTTNFRICDTFCYKKEKGVEKRVFDGFICTHNLKVEFDYTTKRLGETLNAISKCLANPEIDIDFTVKNTAAVKKELLISATQNAREKAEILCAASGVLLGNLLTIDYNWNDIHFHSDMRYCCCEQSVGSAIELEPDDIKTKDSATFVWEIK